MITKADVVTEIEVAQEVLSKIQGMKSWSQVDDASSFKPIINIEKFFNEDLSSLPDHELATSPCYPIINFRAAGKYVMYFCLLHPKTENIHISSLEQHCRFYNTDQHESEILSRIHQSKSKKAIE
jgi:hypothetical protein